MDATSRAATSVFGVDAAFSGALRRIQANLRLLTPKALPAQWLPALAPGRMSSGGKCLRPGAATQIWPAGHETRRRPTIADDTYRRVQFLLFRRLWKNGKYLLSIGESGVEPPTRPLAVRYSLRETRPPLPHRGGHSHVGLWKTRSSVWPRAGVQSSFPIQLVYPAFFVSNLRQHFAPGFCDNCQRQGRG